MPKRGARLASTIPDSSIRPIDDTHIIIQHAYRAALRGASPDDALLGDVTGAQFLHFVDDMFQLLAWYPSNECHRSLQTRETFILLSEKRSLLISEHSL